MAKNPLLEKKYQEGLLRGIEIGKALSREEARQEGRDITIEWFIERFNGLDKVKGIGPKMVEKFVNHFGPEHFEKVKK